MKTFTTYWGEMAYVNSGESGVPILFLHGTGCDVSDWTAVLAKIPDTLRCIALDFRGHGQSSVPTEPFTFANLAEDVLCFIETMKLQEVLLVGHSLGGMVAMAVASQSSCVAGLVLLEGWTSLSAASRAFDAGRLYGRLSKTEVARIRRKAAETRARFSSEVWHSFWTSVQNFDAYPYLQDARIPICEVFGGMGRNSLTEDKLCIPPNPNVEWIWIPNAGHYLPHERPSEVAEIVEVGASRAFPAFTF